MVNELFRALLEELMTGRVSVALLSLGLNGLVSSRKEVTWRTEDNSAYSREVLTNGINGGRPNSAQVSRLTLQRLILVQGADLRGANLYGPFSAAPT